MVTRTIAGLVWEVEGPTLYHLQGFCVSLALDRQRRWHLVGPRDVQPVDSLEAGAAHIAELLLVRQRRST